jgi:uncharacterized protein
MTVVESLKEYWGDLRNPGVVSLYLFGSHAEGRSHGESDVDVGVLLQRTAYPTAQLRFEARLRLTSDLCAHMHRSCIDVVVLNDAPPLLARRIVTTGKRIGCSDSELDHAFVRDCQLRAADIEPFLERTRRIKLATITR